MNLSDTFYVALCMTVLILGAVYWFWTQNQFMLRKLNLLENIVYEMKMALSTGPPQGAPAADNGPGFGGATPYAPAPGSVMSEGVGMSPQGVEIPLNIQLCSEVTTSMDGGKHQVPTSYAIHPNFL